MFLIKNNLIQTYKTNFFFLALLTKKINFNFKYNSMFFTISFLLFGLRALVLPVVFVIFISATCFDVIVDVKNKEKMIKHNIYYYLFQSWTNVYC
jgi:hypothetical protein